MGTETVSVQPFKALCRAAVRSEHQGRRRAVACSLQFIGHELYMLASAQIDSKTQREEQHANSD
jgi:hypothetical protein